jgi:hypothetical protein
LACQVLTGSLRGLDRLAQQRSSTVDVGDQRYRKVKERCAPSRHRRVAAVAMLSHPLAVSLKSKRERAPHGNKPLHSA